MAEIKGIDVSAYNGKIDWKTVAAYGMGFAILRITEKRDIVDSTFEANYKGCIDNNIPVGVYKYSYATSVSQIEQEANIVVKTLNKRILNFPVFLDIEDDCQENLSQSQMQQMIEAFRNIIIKAGYKFGIYCGESWYKTKLPQSVKKYDCWLASYPNNDNGTLQERLRPSFGVGWQYSSKAHIPGINTNTDRSVFYKDYKTVQDNINNNKGESNMSNIVQTIINDAVSYAVGIANDNSHGYSQAVRSLYNITNPKSYDCSSLVLTSYYYAFMKNGLTVQANYLKANCSYTGNMLKMLNCGFEIVAQNQTAHASMVKGDIELNTTYHTAMAIDSNNIVHARSSEGTTDTKDNSGNEIRTQPWYNYSHGWTHRLRFTGKGIDLSKVKVNSSITQPNSTVSTSSKVLKKGSTGESVKTLQKNLNTLINAKLSVDGDFGTATYNAVVSFQKKYGLEVDGIVGTATQAKITTLLKKKTASSTTSSTSKKVGKVMANELNVRSWYGIDSSTGKKYPTIVSYPKLKKTNRVSILATYKVNGETWYKIAINNAATKNKDVIGFVCGKCADGTYVKIV